MMRGARRRPLLALAMLSHVHPAVLHLSVAAHVAGDLVDSLAGYRSWGGLLNAVAMPAFVLNTASAIAGSVRLWQSGANVGAEWTVDDFSRWPAAGHLSPRSKAVVVRPGRPAIPPTSRCESAR